MAFLVCVFQHRAVTRTLMNIVMIGLREGSAFLTRTTCTSTAENRADFVVTSMKPKTVYHLAMVIIDNV
jgi:hypothetical protein